MGPLEDEGNDIYKYRSKDIRHYYLFTLPSLVPICYQYHRHDIEVSTGNIDIDKIMVPMMAM